MGTIEKKGSVRVDLLGGTLDIPPINLIIPDVVTLNVATSLQAKVEISNLDFDGVEVESKDYGKTYKYMAADFTERHFQDGHFGPMTFIAMVLHHFNIVRKKRLVLSSGSPAGAGLGGSSAMGVTLYSALCALDGRKLDREVAIRTVQNIESKILDQGPAGYQDYYPALYGGILALRPGASGVEVNQCYSKELADFLEKHATLVFSGETRSSGINNWEVYKAFFDKKKEVRDGMFKIAELSFNAYIAVKEGKHQQLLELIGEEGKTREKLFPGIVTPSMRKFFQNLSAEVPRLGMKVCGAGGGGCFLLLHDENTASKVKSSVEKAGMKILEFGIKPPLSGV